MEKYIDLKDKYIDLDRGLRITMYFFFFYTLSEHFDFKISMVKINRNQMYYIPKERERVNLSYKKSRFVIFIVV